MLKNYFITAINNLLKNKLYSTINIIGLAVALAACILITLYVRNELSYDKQWEKTDLIYRINKVIRSGDQPADISPETSLLALSALKKYFPEDIEFGTRIIKSGGRFKIGDALYPVLYARVDEDFINIFNFEELQGNLKSTLKSPGNIALSEASAINYFGNRDPIGQILTDDDVQFKVTAVYRLISPITVLAIPAFSLLDESRLPETFQNWRFSGLETYVRLSETADVEAFVSRLPHFVDESIPIDAPRGKKLSDVRSYFPQELSDIYFNPYDPTPSWQPRVGNRTAVTVFITISILVLIIACINFIILTTAKATQRSREVAMRKVVGARFKQLYIQFLGESLLLTLMAFLIAIGITELALPFFEIITDLELTVPYTSPESLVFAFFLTTLVGISGGIYPALILSRFSPVRALKANQTTEAGGSIKLRNVLVVFQFTASIALIIATLVVYFQLLHTRKHDPGYNPDNLLVVENMARPGISEHREALQQELLKLPEVIRVGLSNRQPMELGGGFNIGANYRRKTVISKPGQEIRFKNNLYVDYNFLETYEISLLSGRYFTRDMDQAESVFTQNGDNEETKERRIIINLAAVRQFGYASADEAVGDIVVVDDPGDPYYMEFLIIGVVEDSQYRSLRIKPEPEIYHLSPDSGWFLAVRYQGDYYTVYEKIKRVWYTVIGDIPFRAGSVKQNLATTFSQEEKENKVLIAFALLSIFIACLGLLGTASFTVDRRIKEIGLRKVMGARVKDIVKLLSWQFLKPVFIANIIAWPVGIYAMQNWLERFPYRFNPLYMIPICLCAGLIAFIISWLTVAGNTTHAARKNPIHSLRYE